MQFAKALCYRAIAWCASSEAAGDPGWDKLWAKGIGPFASSSGFPLKSWISWHLLVFKVLGLGQMISGAHFAPGPSHTSYLTCPLSWHFMPIGKALDHQIMLSSLTYMSVDCPVSFKIQFPFVANMRLFLFFHYLQETFPCVSILIFDPWFTEKKKYHAELSPPPFSSFFGIVLPSW